MLREIARGGLLTGVAASIAATLFCLVHLGKYDPWGLPAAAICLVTWAVSLVYWACDFGFRVAAKRANLSSPTPAADRARHRHRISVTGIMGVVLACALLSTLVRQVNKIDGGLWRSHVIVQVFLRLRRGELYDRLRSGDPVDADIAAYALHEIGFNKADRGVLAAAFVDARLPILVRREVGVYLADCPPPHPVEILSVVAGELDSKDPESQVIAAELLSQIAPDAPARFEVNGNLRDYVRSDWEKYRANLDLFRRWWEKRPMGDN
jgi:hypothetical protein